MPALAGSLPVADLLVERLIGLPMHGHLTIADVDHVCHRLEVVCQ
jgi:dTDP-4-amino-4,6-dideoxygalactose transaminase